jgi:DNA-directed RNA polymerase subunit RPC12/RpoP
VLSYPCASCGADLEFAAGADVLRCPHCGHETAIVDPASAVERRPYAEFIRRRRRRVALAGANVFRCPGCDARTETTKIAQRCPFCGTPVVVEVDPAEQIVPDGVLPFAVDRAGLAVAVRRWAQTRALAPNALKQVTDVESWRSAYVPHWVFDATLSPSPSWQKQPGMRQQAHTRTRLSDVTVPASSVVPTSDLTALDPWPIAAARPLSPEYLEGHEAVRYEIEPDTALDTAKQTMRRRVLADADADADRAAFLCYLYRDLWKDPQFTRVDVALVLLPVWVAVYLYAGRTYHVYVNGHTGQASGEFPESRVKTFLLLTAFFVGLTLAVGALLYLELLKEALFD